MAGGEDRTEKPTPKRLREARRNGQIARSPDLQGAGVVAAGVVALSFMGPRMVDSAGRFMDDAFGEVAHPGAVSSAAGLHGLLSLMLSTTVGTIAPIAGICCAVGLLLGVAQTRGQVSFHSLRPSFKALNPVTGAKNVFGSRIGFEIAKTLVKVVAVGVIVAIALIPDLTHLGASVGTTPYALGALMTHGARGIAERGAAAYLLIGLVDFAWQRRRINKSLKMTRQEVRDEMKQQQLPPEVRAAVRRRMMQAARKRMMAAVPKADVVVTNPTHYAVALSYDGERPAPVVVAKGTDHVALQIRRIAEEHDIPIVPAPPLARELHRTVELEQMIPAELYAAVAQVLAFVYRQAARRKVGV